MSLDLSRAYWICTEKRPGKRGELYYSETGFTIAETQAMCSEPKFKTLHLIGEITGSAQWFAKTYEAPEAAEYPVSIETIGRNLELDYPHLNRSGATIADQCAELASKGWLDEHLNLTRAGLVMLRTLHDARERLRWEQTQVKERRVTNDQRVLAYVNADKPDTQAKVVEALKIAQPHVSAIFGRLRKGGFIDGMQLTEKGREAVANIPIEAADELS
jgi:hypothetical protein